VFNKALVKKMKKDVIADSFQESLDKILLIIFPNQEEPFFLYSSRALITETIFILLKDGISKQDFNLQAVLDNLETNSKKVLKFAKKKLLNVSLEPIKST